ncbi:MAG: hypothetical protein V1907_02660 [Candidatus Kerfeldbacteria bacterium]
MDAKEVVSHPWFWIALTVAVHLFVRAALWVTGRLSDLISRQLFQQEEGPADTVDTGPTLQESLQMFRDMSRVAFAREYEPIE